MVLNNGNCQRVRNFIIVTVGDDGGDDDEIKMKSMLVVVKHADWWY